jgi:molybdopterin converting factor subunit 1
VTVQVRLFARLRELCDDQGGLELTLPDGATAADCFAALGERYPAVATLRDGLAVAINDAYAGWGGALQDGDEVAFIPPVSGGSGACRGAITARRKEAGAGRAGEQA